MGSCGITVALTSNTCLKELPKTQAGEVVRFKGWPRLNWQVTESLPKPPKEWQLPPRMAEDSPAYIEVSEAQTCSQYVLIVILRYIHVYT